MPMDARRAVEGPGGEERERLGYLAVSQMALALSDLIPLFPWALSGQKPLRWSSTAAKM